MLHLLSSELVADALFSQTMLGTLTNPAEDSGMSSVTNAGKLFDHLVPYYLLPFGTVELGEGALLSQIMSGTVIGPTEYSAISSVINLSCFLF